MHEVFVGNKHNIIVWICILESIRISQFKKIKYNKLFILYTSFYQLIGGTIVFWGFRTQYLLQKVKSEEVFTDGYIFLIYTILMFGISIFLSNLFIFKTNVSKLYDDYIIEKTNINNSNRMFLFVLILGSICFGSMIYVCNQIGYIPLIELVRGNWILLKNELSLILILLEIFILKIFFV